jgi:predicted secreted acid phosphatase
MENKKNFQRKHMWISTDFNRLKQPIVNILENADPTTNFVALDIDSTVLNLLENRRLEPEPTGLFVRNVAEENNIPVVYITARQESPQVRQITLDELSQVGIHNPSLLILRPPDAKTWKEISQYKQNARNYVEFKTNSRCLMNVGDQWTDLMPIHDFEWRAMRQTFDDQYMLFHQNVNGVDRWSVKLKEN